MLASFEPSQRGVETVRRQQYVVPMVKNLGFMRLPFFALMPHTHALPCGAARAVWRRSAGSFSNRRQGPPRAQCVVAVDVIGEFDSVDKKNG